MTSGICQFELLKKPLFSGRGFLLYGFSSVPYGI
jgi:hypothetical protein